MDVREKLVELLKEISYDQKFGWYDLWDMREGAEDIADLLISHGVTVIENDLPNPKLEEMELSVRAYNVLKRAGLNTANDIAELDYFQILRIRNLGKHTYDEVIEKLQTLGYNTEALMPQPPKGE